MTPTHTQEAEADEESDPERTAKGKKKKAGTGADTGGMKQTRPRPPRGAPKPANAPLRKGGAPATSPPPLKVRGFHCLVDFAGFHGSLFLDLQA